MALCPFQTEKCGSGVVADEDVNQGEFVIEYVGEGAILLRIFMFTLLIKRHFSLHFWSGNCDEMCSLWMQLLMTKHVRRGFGKWKPEGKQTFTYVKSTEIWWLMPHIRETNQDTLIIVVVPTLKCKNGYPPIFITPF